MADVSELEALHKELLEVRASGALKVKFRDRETWYQDGEQLAAAIADLERRIADTKGSRVRTVRVFASKGI